MRFIFLLFINICLFAVDYDVVIIGSSPFSLFEALYQYHSGKKVAILEQAPECGGAWKAIDICGISHVDLGCHQIGHDMNLKAFLEEYAGCKIVSHDNPLAPFDAAYSPNGYYFSRGCFELIDHLLKLVAVTQIDLRLNHKVENISFDPSQKVAHVQTKNGSFTTSKLIVTPMSCFSLNQSNANAGTAKYYHLYLLIQDPTSPRFTYRTGSLPGASRLINLTHYVGLTNTGQHLIVIQTHGDQYLSDPQGMLTGLKSQKLVDESAYLLRSESYIYESGYFHQWQIQQVTGAQEMIEVLQTGHIQNLATYVSKWKKVLKPYREIVRHAD